VSECPVLSALKLTCSVTSCCCTSTPRSAGLMLLMGFFLAFMMLGSVAYLTRRGGGRGGGDSVDKTSVLMLRLVLRWDIGFHKIRVVAKEVRDDASFVAPVVVDSQCRIGPVLS